MTSGIYEHKIPPWNKGLKGVYVIEENRGKKNKGWKGDKAGYRAIHYWVEARLIKPELCPCCKRTKPCELANISQKYLRDLNDWEWLCRSCHMHKDGRIKELLKWQLINRKRRSVKIEQGEYRNKKGKKKV